MKRRLFCTVLLCALLPLGLSGCGEDFTVVFRNRTGVAISELLIAPETDKGDMPDALNAAFPDDAAITVSLGDLDADDIADGFALEVYSAADGSSADFGRLMLESGDTVTLYLDDWGLAVGVNMTDEEIDAQKQRDHEDAVNAPQRTTEE